MPSVNANGVDLYHEVNGHGAAILGIHGTPSSALMWADAARELSAHGRCVIYDRRGFFRSERPRPFESVDLTDHVDDARQRLAGSKLNEAASSIHVSIGSFKPSRNRQKE